jgi:glycosyltransferase involved in cell wall biosynthesis
MNNVKKIDNIQFVILVPGFNNQDYLEYNLNSILSQDYSLFRVLYTDDCSTDNTREKVTKWRRSHDQDSRITFFFNNRRIGALNNIYNMAQECKDQEVILLVDGDDWLAHPNVLNVLNKIYKENNSWITYGQHKLHPTGKLGCSWKIPNRIIRKNSYRNYKWCSSHLRSFYAWLFKKIRKEDLMKDGEFYCMAWDFAIMLPMLEMAGRHQQFISDILYIYNFENPLSDHIVDRKLQKSLKTEICKKTKYVSLDTA